jgi:uroporphyrinogen-III synthase
MAILVIRYDDKFSSALRDAGFDVVNLELIETKPLDDLSDLRRKLSELSEYDGVFFTSPVAAEIFVQERDGSNGFHGCVYTLGQRAQTLLSTSGLKIREAKTANTADELLSAFGNDEFAGKRFLFVRGEKSLRTIPESLKGRALVDEVAVYQTVPAEVDPSVLENVKMRLSAGEIELVCFFSPSGVNRFAELFGNAAKASKAAAIGTTTADEARRAGFDVEFISLRSNADDFARGLIDHVKTSD